MGDIIQPESRKSSAESDDPSMTVGQYERKRIADRTIDHSSS
ncbi:hypothetical protein [Thiorhodococcus mannitoliphagus]|nr:hypothetical protein [Thiorhodococcus mannitoliphagus]